MKINLSNILTLSRIIVIPVIVLMIYLKEPIFGWLAFILFCIASITDFFDGYFARIRNEVSNLGTFLDPIADKLLVSSVILLFQTPKGVPNWTIVVSIILLSVIWISTLILQVPYHERLVSGFDKEIHDLLVKTNWIRTICWSLRGIIVLIILDILIKKYNL